MIVAAYPTLSFATHEDGAREVVSPWFPFIVIADAAIAQADARRLILRGDELTFRCTNGGATYALTPPDAAGGRAGRLLSRWP